MAQGEVLEEEARLVVKERTEIISEEEEVQQVTALQIRMLEVQV